MSKSWKDSDFVRATDSDFVLRSRASAGMYCHIDFDGITGGKLAGCVENPMNSWSLPL